MNDRTYYAIMANGSFPIDNKYFISEKEAEEYAIMLVSDKRFKEVDVMRAEISGTIHPVEIQMKIDKLLDK